MSSHEKDVGLNLGKYQDDRGNDPMIVYQDRQSTNEQIWEPGVTEQMDMLH